MNIDTNSWNFLISQARLLMILRKLQRLGQDLKLHTACSKLSRLIKPDFDTEVKLAKALKSGSVVHFNRPSFPSGSLHSTTSTMGSATSSYATYLWLKRFFFFFRRFTCGLWSEQEKSPRPAESNAKPHRTLSQPWSACYLPPPHLDSHPPRFVTTLKKTHTGCGLKNKN